jgi:hypothetical protein
MTSVKGELVYLANCNNIVKYKKKVIKIAGAIWTWVGVCWQDRGSRPMGDTWLRVSCLHDTLAQSG